MANNYGTFVFPKISREYIITVAAVWDDKSKLELSNAQQRLVWVIMCRLSLSPKLQEFMH